MSQKGFVNIVLVIVIVAVITVGGYFIFSKKSTTDWKTYTNSQYGFELNTQIIG